MSTVFADPAAADEAFAITLPPRPYPGLRPFDEAEWPVFFGRERMVDAVVSKLVTQQLVVVHGDSGSGKSSLIRAGVLPRLRQEQARGGSRWRTVAVMPRGGPLRHLARALAALDGRADDADRVLALRRALNQGRRAPVALAELLLCGPHDHLCILIDQFEELFEHARLQGPGEARQLTDALVAMAESPPPGLYVAVTMRSEYLGACARFAGLAEAVNRHQYLLPPMTVTDLLRAIREPARLYGGDVDAALAERLAADAAGIDGLPLAQHALMLMQREHAPLPDDLDTVAPWRLTMSHYPAGGLAEQLSRHADAVAQQAQAAVPARHRLVEDLLRALTTVNAEGHAVRRPQPLAALAAALQVDVPVLARAIDVFRAEGVTFLVPRGARPLVADDWIDICHETLIRCWRALADPQGGWLASEFRNGLVWRALLVQAESFERDPDNVLSPATTEERMRWLQRRNPAWAERYGGGWDRVQALIAASEARVLELALQRQGELEARAHGLQAQERALLARQSEQVARQGEQRARTGTRAALAAAALALLFAVVAVRQWQSADSARQSAEGLRQDAETASTATAALRDSARARADELELVLKILKARADAATSLPTLQGDVFNAWRQVGGLADQLRSAPQPVVVANPPPGATPDPTPPMLPVPAASPAARQRPLVYVQYADPAQKAAVQRFQQALQKQRVDGVAINAPGVEARPTSTPRHVLRCFRAAECRDDAPKVLAALNALLDSPQLEIQDVSATYENTPGIRPRQYEVWFAAGEIRLSSSAIALK